jgi:hypothetical protein
LGIEIHIIEESILSMGENLANERLVSRKEANEASNEPHFLLNESGDQEAEYVPTQFHNSLGRLQVSASVSLH